MSEGSWVGLDVHARSVVAGVIDGGSGEVRSLRVSAGSDATVAWLIALPAPVRVVYEAGPTGYGLARACAAAGISCVVAAPSRIPAGSRQETPTGGTLERLARLLRLGEVTSRSSRPASNGSQFERQLGDATLDLVTDLAHRLDVLTCGVLQVPVDVAPARDDGQASPQPIVTTMSAHSASAVSSCFGTRSASSGINSATSGCTRDAGVVPAERALPPRPSYSACAICDRPAFCLQTKRTFMRRAHHAMRRSPPARAGSKPTSRVATTRRAQPPAGS